MNFACLKADLPGRFPRHGASRLCNRVLEGRSVPVSGAQTGKTRALCGRAPGSPAHGGSNIPNLLIFMFFSFKGGHNPPLEPAGTVGEGSPRPTPVQTGCRKASGIGAGTRLPCGKSVCGRRVPAPTGAGSETVWTHLQGRFPGLSGCHGLRGADPRLPYGPLRNCTERGAGKSGGPRRPARRSDCRHHPRPPERQRPAHPRRWRWP